MNITAPARVHRLAGYGGIVTLRERSARQRRPVCQVFFAHQRRITRCGNERLEAEPVSLAETVIRPASGWQLRTLRNSGATGPAPDAHVARYLGALQQTALGIAWAVLQPMGDDAVFAVCLGGWDACRRARCLSLFVFAGCCRGFFSPPAWPTLLRAWWTRAPVTKIYFPRLCIPWQPLRQRWVDSSLLWQSWGSRALLWRKAGWTLDSADGVGLLGLTAAGVGTLLAAF